MQTIRILAISAGLGALWMLTLPASAEVYKWTDASGVVHYGQLPPAGAQAVAIGAAEDAEPAAGSPTTDPSAPAVDEAEAEKVRAEQTAREAKRKEEMADYCAKSRAELQKLDENPSHRLASVNENGERVRMTQADYDANRAKLQAAIDKHCN